MTNVHRENGRTYDGALAGRVSAVGLPGVAKVRAGATEALDTVYFDTGDLRLLRRGVTLRRIAGGDDAGWQLTVPDGRGEGRTEIRLPPGSGETHTPPGELLARTRVAARGAPVAAVAHLRTRRDLTLLVGADGRTLAEVARDTVAAELPGPSEDRPAHAGGRTPATTWTETEVELTGGAPELLDAVEDVLAGCGLQPAPALSGLVRVLDLEHRVAVGADDGRAAEPAGPLRPAKSIGDSVTAYLRDQVAALQELDPAVRLDEPDSVHRMRVRVRRLRSALAAHRRILDTSGTEPVDGELRWLGKVLGRARDAEVLGVRLTEQAAELPADAHPGRTGRQLRSWFDRRYEHARTAAVEAMDSGRYFALLDALEALAASPPLRRRAGRGKAEARRMLERQRRRTAGRLGAALELPPGPERDRALHGARKAAKRSRYAAESVTPLLERRSGRLRKRMKKIQEPLGGHQDGVMGEEALLAIVSEASPAAEEAFGLGVLYTVQRRRQERQLEAAAAAAKRLRR